MFVEKAIVTNVEALRAKYGARHRDVLASLRRLVEADARRGITSRLFDLSGAASLAVLGERPVRGRGDWRGAKRVVDAIDLVFGPQYFLLVGAGDVVPFHRFDPLVDARGRPIDPDEAFESDLPYACDERAGLPITAYVGPTRVVGRLPDVPGAAEPSFLLRVLSFAARARPSPRERFDRFFALSAQDWLLASLGLLEAAYGRVRRGEIQLSPGPARWRRHPELMSAPLHYHNCHGGPFEPQVQGTLEGIRGHRETALWSEDLVQRLSRGTVLVTEACFGATLYDPYDARAIPQGALSISLRYLAEGGAGVFGSSSTTFGGDDRLGGCGLMCLPFLQRLLAGASLGRAALEARQAFAAHARDRPDPFKLKTLAQFNLLGDPSIHPVEVAPPALRAGGRRYTARQARAFRTQARRENLRSVGIALREEFPDLVAIGDRRERARAVRQFARELQIPTRAQRDAVIHVFDVKPRVSRHDRAMAHRVAVSLERIAERRLRVTIERSGGNLPAELETLFTR